MNGHSTVTETKSVIVTGGASGLGLSMTQHFACQGHKVTVLDVNIDAGQAVVAEISSQYPDAEVTFKKCDVSSWKDQAEVFKQVYQEAGRIDIVMANAGISEQGVSSLMPVEEEEPSEPRLKVLDVNLNGVIYGIKLATHYMQKNPPSANGSRGSIICTASNAGIYPFPMAPLYAASKSGIIGLVRSMAGLLEKHAIQIHALAPALLESNLAPSKELFEGGGGLTITPKTTLIRGIAQLLIAADPRQLNGAVAEIHGDKVTLRPHQEYVDEESRANVEAFSRFGRA
ncbi:putative short chain dehydrogenase/reductase [Xylariomycetidae sp. FL2044]|nr:putative short chain dehydrogenase/reductase [Xylariomycetidae sp. FL2044]